MNIAGTDIALEPSAYSPGLSLSREDFRALCEQLMPLVMAQLFEKRASRVYCPVPAAVRDAFLDTPVLLLDMVDNSFGLCKSFLGAFFVSGKSGQDPQPGVRLRPIASAGILIDLLAI